MTLERRTHERIPAGFYIHQVIEDDLHRCFLTDLSPMGLFMQRPVDPFDRRSNIVQVELPLPGIADTLWARAEVVYDRIDSLFHGTALCFTGMARKHRRVLHEWLEEVHHGYLDLPIRGDSGASNVRVLRPGMSRPCVDAA